MNQATLLRRVLALLVAVALFGAACGGDSDDTSSDNPTPAPTNVQDDDDATEPADAEPRDADPEPADDEPAEPAEPADSEPADEPAPEPAASTGDAPAEVIALVESEDLIKVYSSGPYKGAACATVASPDPASLQGQWECTAEGGFGEKDFTVGLDADGTYFISNGPKAPDNSSDITELAAVDLATDHGYEIALNTVSCSNRVFVDASYERNCTADLEDGSGAVSYQVLVLDNWEQTYELANVTSP